MNTKKQPKTSNVHDIIDLEPDPDARAIIKALAYLIQQAKRLNHLKLISILEAAMRCILYHDSSGRIAKGTPEDSLKIIMFLEKFLGLEKEHQEEVLRTLELEYIEELLNDPNSMASLH